MMTGAAAAGIGIGIGGGGGTIGGEAGNASGGGGRDVSTATYYAPDSINIAVTSPAALIAFCFLYLQTDNQTAAARIQIPHTLSTLNNCTAQHAMLRVLTRSLILWSGIAPTHTWMEEVCPRCVLKYAAAHPPPPPPAAAAAAVAHGRCSSSSRVGMTVAAAIAVQDSSSAGMMEYDDDEGTDDDEVDLLLIHQYYCLLMAAGCFAIGLKFAGMSCAC